MAKQERVNETQDVSQKDLVLIVLSTVTAMWVSIYYRNFGVADFTFMNILGLIITTLAILIIIYLVFSKFQKFGEKVMNIAFWPGFYLIQTPILKFIKKTRIGELLGFLQNEKTTRVRNIIVTLIVLIPFVLYILKSQSLFQKAGLLVLAAIFAVSLFKYAFIKR